MAALHNGHLVLVSPNATWATRLRLRSADIAAQLRRSTGLDIQQIDVKIAPIQQPEPEIRHRKGLPPAAVEALQRFAEDSGDPEIEALIKGPNSDRNGQ